MLAVEFLEEIAADVTPDGALDESQVFFVILVAESNPEELLEALAGRYVVMKS